LPEAINWKEGTQFKLARNRYLKRSGLDEIIKGLQGLREAVTLTGARVEAIELKAAVIEQFAGRLSEAESRIANIGSQRIDTPGGRSLFRRPPLWERVDLSQDQWRRLPAFPFKHNIENYFDERKNIRIILFTIGYLIIATASLMFYGASIIYISNVGHIVFVVVNVLYAILLFLVMLLLVSFGIPRRKYQGVGLSGKIDDEISKELEFNVKLIRAGYGEIPSLFGFPFSMPAGLIPCILGVFGIVSIYFIGYKLSAELGFQPLSITP